MKYGLFFILLLSSTAAFTQSSQLKLFEQLAAQAGLGQTQRLNLQDQSLEKQYAQWSLRTRLLPRLGLSTFHGKLSEPQLLTGETVGSDLHRLELTASMPLVSVTLWRALRVADKEYQIARLRAQLAEQESLSELLQVLGQFLKVRYQLVSATAALQLSERVLAEVETRYRLGSRTQIDLLKAQAQVSLVRSQLAGLSPKLSETRAQLAAHLGMQVQDTVIEELEQQARSEQQLSQWVQVLRSRLSEKRGGLLRMTELLQMTREEIAQNYQQLFLRGALQQEEDELTEARAAQLTSSLWPEIALTASLSRTKPQWQDWQESQGESQRYGITLTWTAFAFGESYFVDQQKQAALRQVQRLSQVNQLQTVESLWQDLLAKKALENQLISLAKRVEQTKEIERLTDKSYQLGRLALTDLQIAQNDRKVADSEYFAALIDELVLDAKLQVGLVGAEQGRSR